MNEFLFDGHSGEVGSRAISFSYEKVREKSFQMLLLDIKLTRGVVVND